MSVLAEKIAAEYIRLLEEGWEPDLEEFLSRVPLDHRGDCGTIPDDTNGEPGPRKLTKAEARAMFREMEARAKRSRTAV